VLRLNTGITTNSVYRGKPNTQEDLVHENKIDHIYSHMKKKGHPSEFHGFPYQDIIKKLSGPWQILKFEKKNSYEKKHMTCQCHY